MTYHVSWVSSKGSHQQEISRELNFCHMLSFLAAEEGPSRTNRLSFIVLEKKWLKLMALSS